VSRPVHRAHGSRHAARRSLSAVRSAAPSGRPASRQLGRGGHAAYARGARAAPPSEAWVPRAPDDRRLMETITSGGIRRSAEEEET
jgi:hypothetical protein